MDYRLYLLSKYKDLPPEIISGYNPAATSIFVNEDDKDLSPIEIPLPKNPEEHTIDGFGKKAEDQMFEKQVYPIKLKRLEQTCETIDDIWVALEKDKAHYKNEIEWIKLQWKRRIEGYWCYINGTPTYINGWHYFYLNFWELDDGLPSYRSRDRKFFLFARFCYDDPYSFGFAYPKHRREGATSKASCIHYAIISILFRSNGGIQSMTEEHGKTVFIDHIIAPWKSLPFFFKPNYDGSTEPKSTIRFVPPAQRLSGGSAVASSDKGLGSSIGFKSASKSAYDTYKLYFYHADEIGKSVTVDITERWQIVKPCLHQGPNIHGFTIQTSTVGDMEKGGGKNFEDLCKGSDFHDRNENNQTKTGLYVLFTPAYDGLDGHVDKYGNSMIKEAKKYLENERASFIKQEDYEGLSEHIRQFPTAYKECFRTSAKTSGFNLQIIETRMDDLRFSEQPRRGNFVWENGPDSKVIWVNDKEHGKFLTTKLLPDNRSSMFYYDNELDSYVPTQGNDFTAGADPFKFNKTKGTRKSNGGGAVFWKRDFMLDPDDGRMRDWRSNRFICTYSFRPEDKRVYAEDMLMMSVYYGAMMYPEVNVPLIWEYFEERGYLGFLIFGYDIKKGRFNPTPGASTGTKVVQEIFTEWMTYIQRHGHREEHMEILSECREINGPDDMTNYDLFAAGGYALLGAKSHYSEVMQKKEEYNDLGSFVTMNKY